MDLFGETKFSRSEILSRYFVKYVQPPQGNLSIRTNIEPRHSENKPMQNIFQRVKGGKALHRRVIYPISGTGH
jgi:hypothetical protein